jgi:hypothetical protein
MAMANESRKIMGYRSEVALALTTDAAILLKALSNHSSTLKELISCAEEKINWSDEEIRQGSAVKLYWPYIKWYEGDTAVEQIQTFLDNTDEESWLFVRIGEDHADCDQSGQFYESETRVERHIVL